MDRACPHAPSPLSGRRDIRRFLVLTAADRHAPLPIQTLLVPAPLVRLVVPPAPLVGLLAAVVLTATERAAEISPIRVSRMRQKADSAMAAVNRTACQIRTIAQDSIQRQSDTDEQAGRRGRLGANPDEMKRISRPLPQKRQILG